MSDIQNAVSQAQDIAPEIKTMADVGLDAASLAAQTIGKAEGLKDPDVAAQKIVQLETLVNALSATVEGIPQLVASLKSDNAAAIQAAVDNVAKTLPDYSQLKSSVDQIEAAIPDLVKVKTDVETMISDIDSALPENWKSRISSLLHLAAQHFGV